ncbi:MAG TPA: ParB/RepB/Spo0J family partition protein [Candidatus Binataceae bacterium]|nr:ParB/RepB/Spo0J family partition protein [Candidatus Binataceae bacterium]
MNRRPLGRGLDALINGGDTAASVNGHVNAEPASNSTSSVAVLMVDTERIVMNRFQPRQVFAPEAIEELAAAIKAQGIIEPLIVRPGAAGNYELIAGERRLRASRLAKLEQVPVIVRELDDRDALEMSLVENLLRENLNPIEEGSAFSRLNREFALTHEDIADRIGKSRAYVTNMIRLTELPESIVELINSGRLTAGQVRPLLALHSSAEQLEQARRILDGNLTAREAEQLAAERKRSSKPATKTNTHEDPNLKALSESIQRVLKRKVQITQRRGRRPGRIELEYYSDDDLTILAQTLVQHMTH